jgi:hypothetical protein
VNEVVSLVGSDRMVVLLCEDLDLGARRTLMGIELDPALIIEPMGT